MATKTLKTKKKKLSKQEMRVAIAKDALNQLRVQSYIATEGLYIGSDLLHECAVEGDVPAQPLLQNIKECPVCAKGAIYLSTVRKFNDAMANSLRSDSEFKAREIFGDKNLNKIEAAFESWMDEKEYNNGHRIVPKTKLNAFINKHPDTEERLEAILKNVIRNKGTFKP